MNAKKLYELHKGKELTINGAKCIVCGYYESKGAEPSALIVAFTGKPIYFWRNLDSNDIIITNNNNYYGYWYIDENDLNS